MRKYFATRTIEKVSRVLLVTFGSLSFINHLNGGDKDAALVIGLYVILCILDLISYKTEDSIHDIEKRVRARTVKVEIMQMMLDHVRTLERNGEYEQAQIVLRAVDPINYDVRLEKIIRGDDQ